jgi:phospholipase C
VIISPLIPKNTIDHRLYDHTSIPATIEQLFGLAPLTNRDRAASTVLPLLSLAAPRNTPTFLPFPTPPLVVPAAAPMAFAPSLTARPHDSVNDGNLPVVIQAAMRQEIELSPPGERENIIARVAGLKTRADAANYLNQVVAKRQAKPAPGFR